MLTYTCFALVVIVCHMLSLFAIAFGWLGSVERWLFAVWIRDALLVYSCAMAFLLHLACEVMVSKTTLVIVVEVILRPDICLGVYAFVYISFLGHAIRCTLTLCAVWITHGCLVSCSLVVACACVLLSVSCCLSCLSIAVCCVYSCVLMLAFVSVLLQFVGLGQLQSFITFWRVTTNYISPCFCSSPAFACVFPVQAWVCW